MGNRRHYWVGRNDAARYAKFGDRVGGGAGYHVVDTEDETLAVRANNPAELMKELGVQYRRYRPHLLQIDTEVISQCDWPSEADVWGEAYAN